MDEQTSILIADDDEGTCRSLAQIFRRKGYDTETVGTGREAIEQVRGRSYNLALVDIKLPDMQGIDVLASLKEVCPDIVVVMVTAYASLETAVSALIRGASAYLIKPLNVDEVLVTVGDTIEKQHLAIENKRLYEEARRELAERERAEETVRSERDNLIRILEGMGDGVCIVGQGCSVEYVNPALETEYGPPDGHKCYQYLHAGEMACPWCPSPDRFGSKVTRWEWHSTVSPKIYDLVDTPLKNPDGSISELMIFRDITEHKQVEELFRTLSFRSPVGVYIVQDGEFRYVNPQLQRFMGYSEEELLGTDPLSYVHSADRDVVRESATRMLAGELVQPYEYRIVNKAGATGWVMETVTAIQYRGRLATLGNHMDVTAHKHLEKKMVEYEELDRLKTNLLSTVSHELRTPLAIIKGYSTMLLDYDCRLQEDEKHQHLRSIDRATDRLTELVDHLLDMSRMDAGLMKLDRAPTSISKVIREAVAEARLTAPGSRIVSRVRDRLPRINIDARRIRQVVDNLIDNAVKYSGDESSVVMEAQRVDRELRISVADQGIGIPAEDIDKVFNRMYRAEQRLTYGSGGLGLGLSVCKGMVEAHGGKIWVESQVGEGSTFYFTLPLTNEAEEEHGRR